MYSKGNETRAGMAFTFFSTLNQYVPFQVISDMSKTIMWLFLLLLVVVVVVVVAVVVELLLLKLLWIVA